MRVLVAPCSFKGSLSAKEAAQKIASGLRAASPEIETVLCPLADGGEGTLELLLEALRGEKRPVRVEDPLGREIQAYYGLLPKENTAILETARAVGLTLLSPEERDPLRASTYGVGQLIKAALDQGAEALWIGLGGSATVDGGLGMLQALGAKVLDPYGRVVPPGGQGLFELASIDLSSIDPRIWEVELIVLCDVLSPLLGPKGSQLYMPQKGASPQMCRALEQGLERFCERTKQVAGIDVRELPGAGAAGGLGAALALLGGKLLSGSEFFIKQLRIEGQLKGCDLVISGEGRIDEQTLEGKGIWALARLARVHKKPLIVLCGLRAIELETLHQIGVTAALPIVPGPIPLEEALIQAAENLQETARQLSVLLSLQLDI